VKDSVTKKKLAGFVNEKLKTLGYKPRKLRIGKRTFKQAQAKQDDVAPRAFPFQKNFVAPPAKATLEDALRAERELEDLQKRREPENIEFFQYTKDVLMDLAKKANIPGRSTMNKGQLITALSNVRDITPAKVEEAKKEVVEKKQLEAKTEDMKEFKKIGDLDRDFTYTNKSQAIKAINRWYDTMKGSYPEHKIEVLKKQELRKLTLDELQYEF